MNIVGLYILYSVSCTLQMNVVGLYILYSVSYTLQMNFVGLYILYSVSCAYQILHSSEICLNCILNLFSIHPVSLYI